MENQLCENDSICKRTLIDAVKVYLSEHWYQKQQKYKEKEDFEFWAWASHFIMIWHHNR